jgi:uncharacterized membrane protein YgcG
MTRPTANYALDWLTFLLLACLAATGLLLHYSLPAGSGGNSVLSMTRHEWGDVHFWIALGFLGVIGVHLLLHSAWIKALTVGKTGGTTRRWRVGLALAAAVAALALVFVLTMLPVTVGSGRGQGSGEGRGGRESFEEGRFGGRGHRGGGRE